MLLEVADNEGGGGQRGYIRSKSFEFVRLSEILMFRRKTFAHLPLVKIRA